VLSIDDVVGNNDMTQSVVKRGNGMERPAAYWETIRDRIDTGSAVTVINRVVRGKQYRKKAITPMQAQMAWNVVRQQLPTMAAIAVEVSHRTATNLSDLEDRAAALGIDSNALLGQPIESKGETIHSVPEETVSQEDSLEAPLPPDVTA
jgi:hypothetical protein